MKGSEGLTGKDPISHSKPAHSGTEHSLERLIISPNEQSTRVTTQGRADRSNKASPEASHGVIKSKAPAESPVTFEPYVTLKNRRRSRHLFTDAEDEALVKGYAAHGFQWTLIQQDKRLNLGHRKATDLRDRFRNKFPEVYRHGGAVGGKALQAEGNSRLEATEKAQAAKQKKPRLLNRIENTSHSARPLDAALSPLAPPHALLPDASASFQLPDDHSGTSSDTPWEDNTLPPMIWDELP